MNHRLAMKKNDQNSWVKAIEKEHMKNVKRNVCTAVNKDAKILTTT
jgi:hypothetical protein